MPKTANQSEQPKKTRAEEKQDKKNRVLNKKQLSGKKVEPTGSDITDVVLDADPKQKQKQKQRSFCVIWCKASDRMLVERRRDSSDSRKSGAYGLFGGGANSGELPIQNIKRELSEEIGVKFKWFDFAHKVPGTKTTIFVKVVAKEFKPRLSYESTGYRWIHDFLEVYPLHNVVTQNYSLLRRLVTAARKSVDKTPDTPKLRAQI